MRKLGRRRFRLAAGLSLVALAAPAQGFGLKTHLYIADRVWQDLADCQVAIHGRDFPVPDEACRAIRDHRGEFLSGALGPDVFPDILVGQSIVHPGVRDGWQANQWLDHLLRGAHTDAELAFAWGYAMHFAGDVFAHSYVNNYAGGVFEIASHRTKAIELRHFRLEKYIDQHLDYRIDPTILRVPAAFLSAALIQYDYGAAGGRAPGDLGDEVARDAEGLAQRSLERLRHGGPAAPAMTLAAMLNLARLAARDMPGREAEELARLQSKERQLRALEDELGVAHSDTMVFDRRNPEWARLDGQQRSRLQVAYRLYRTQVEAWQQARALTAFTAAWAHDLEIAAERYIEASLEFGVEMLGDGAANRPPFAERRRATLAYRRWLACYFPVLEGSPADAGDAVCARMRAMGSDLSPQRAALLAVVGARPRASYFRLLELDRYLHGLFQDLVVWIIGFGDRSFADLLDEGLAPQPISAATLNATFAAAPNGQLPFRCVADWIDADLGLRGPPASGDDDICDGAARSGTTIDPTRFAALDNALTLARLALLDQEGIRAVATAFGGDPGEMRMGSQARYSLLLDSVRSLDGSQQWSGWALPFPRRQAYRSRPELGHFGYPLPDGAAGPAGFPFYQSPGLRRTVFSALFQPFEGAILMRAEMHGPAYPYRACDGDMLRPGAQTGLPPGPC